ncbi:MAG TPA: response regulator [Myxococcaceae bacterium]|nr:response regulator [Myxococcaceae bacterium]
MSESKTRGGAAGTVLVIDDDTDLLYLLAESIRGTGRTVFTAADGGAGIALLDSPEVPRPCLVLLDWKMHPMGGEEFLKCLRARPDADGLPVLIMSADTHVPSKTITGGVLGTLQKPFEYGDLLAVLDEHC